MLLSIKQQRNSHMKSIKLLDSEYQNQNIDQMTDSFHEFIREMRLGPDYYNSKFISERTKQFLDNNITDDNLNKFSSLRFYWLTLVEKLLYLDSLHEELEDSDTELSLEIESDIFDFWNKSEYMQVFLELMDKRPDLVDNSLELLPMLENQIIAFYFLHIHKTNYDGPSLLYTIVPEFGDNENFFYVGENLLEYELPNDLPIFPSLVIKSIDNSKGEITIEREDEEHTITSTNKALTLNHPIRIIPFHKNLEENKEKIEKALNIIQTIAPKLYSTFCQFTKVIIPVDDPGIVSFSMQELPGFSSLNLFNRDFVDLLDDLLHENGHHYLNSILNHTHLINEDDEMIYYSPWRKSRRPIRGIYHAYFTFYWALLLFDKLTEENESGLNSKQLNKCRLRFCEEFLMLNYCWDDLVDAEEKGKIETQGMEVIRPIQSHIEKLSAKFEKDFLILEGNDKEEIEKLKTTLESERNKKELL